MEVGSTTTSLTVQIAGAADIYTATDSLSFQKIGGGVDERSFSGFFRGFRWHLSR